MSLKMLIPCIVKVSVLGYFHLSYLVFLHQDNYKSKAYRDNYPQTMYLLVV